jgi:hypothetical protein
MGNDRVFNGAAAATKALIRQTHRYGVWDAVSRTAEKDRFVNGLSSRLANCALFDDAKIAVARRLYDLFLHRALIGLCVIPW